MKWLFFQSQSHRPAHVCREVFVASSPHPETQLWGPCHSIKMGLITFSNTETIGGPTLTYDLQIAEATEEAT